MAVKINPLCSYQGTHRLAEGYRLGDRRLLGYQGVSPRRGSTRLDKSTAQIALVSVPSNIAEGQGRATRGEFIQFLSHARGSLFEFETQIVIAGKLGYITPDMETDLSAKAAEVARILNGLLTSLASHKPRTCPLAALCELSTIHHPLSTALQHLARIRLHHQPDLSARLAVARRHAPPA